MPAEAAKVLTMPGITWSPPLPREEWLEVGSMPLAVVAFDEVILCNALNTTIATGAGGMR